LAIWLSIHFVQERMMQAESRFSALAERALGGGLNRIGDRRAFPRL
jgi:hypothetical protein